VLVVVGRGSLVGESEQHHARDATTHQAFHAGYEGVTYAALEQVGEQHQHGVGGPGDQLLAIGDGVVDVGAAAKLDAEEHVDRIGRQRAEVDHARIEGDDRRAQRTQRGEH
jgi:hypothetical protein